MAVDWTINLTGVITVVVMVVGGIAAWVTALNRIAGHSQRFADLALTVSALSAQDKLLAEQLAGFRIEVAKDYATNASIQQVEERVVAAIDRLGDRLDKIIDGQVSRGQRE